LDLNLVFRSRNLHGGTHKTTLGTPQITEDSSDLRLWRNFQEGSDSAYETIYRNYAASLFAFGLKLTRDKELVKDCIQDLFVEIWKSKHRLASVKSIKSYLFKSIRRKVIAESVKKRKKFTDNVLAKLPKYLQDCSVEVSLIESQNFTLQQQKLKMAMSMLTDRQKEIIHLKFYSFLSYVEISEVMSLSMKGTYKLMGRSICRLRKHMKS